MRDGQIAETVGALPDRFASRIPDVDLERLRLYASVGEWAELLDLLVAVLRGASVTVTMAERDELVAILADANMETEEAAQLDVVD